MVTAVHAYDTPIAAAVRMAPYACTCGHELEVHGRDRHRRYYELDDTTHREPVMTRSCPMCKRGLPGKNPW
jgi:hypothetical protein